MADKENKFASALEGIRSLRNESLREFGLAVGINDRATISRYKSGIATPKPETVLKFAALALDRKDTQSFVPALLSPIIEESKASPAATVLWFLISQSHPSGLPTAAELKPILARAKALLGE